MTDVDNARKPSVPIPNQPCPMPATDPPKAARTDEVPTTDANRESVVELLRQRFGIGQR